MGTDGSGAEPEAGPENSGLWWTDSLVNAEDAVGTREWAEIQSMVRESWGQGSAGLDRRDHCNDTGGGHGHIFSGTLG